MLGKPAIIHKIKLDKLALGDQSKRVPCAASVNQEANISLSLLPHSHQLRVKALNFFEILARENMRHLNVRKRSIALSAWKTTDIRSNIVRTFETVSIAVYHEKLNVAIQVEYSLDCHMSNFDD